MAKRRKAKKKKLSAKARRQRRLDKNPLYDPGTVLRGHSLADAVHNIVGLQYAPQERAIDRGERNTFTQGTALAGRAKGYYRDVAAREAQNVARQGALASATNSQLAGIASESQGQIAAAKAGEEQRQGADQNLRGEGLSGGPSQAISELAAQRANAASSGQAFRSAGVLQGAAGTGLASSMAGAHAMHGAEEQGQLTNKLLNALAELRTKRTDLASDRGAAESKALLDLRQSGFENLATAKGLGLKEEDLAITAADKAAQRKLAKQKTSDARRHNKALEGQGQSRIGETGRHNRVTEGISQQNANKKPAGGKGAKSLTPAARRGYRSSYQKAIGKIRTGKGLKKGGRNAGDFIDLLTASGVPSEIARAAAETVKYGGASPKLRRTIRKRYGFWVKGRKRHKKGVPYKHGFSFSIG